MKILAKIASVVLLLAVLWKLPLAIQLKDPKFIFECAALACCAVGVIAGRRTAAKWIIGILAWSKLLQIAHCIDRGFSLEDIHRIVVAVVYILIMWAWLASSKNVVEQVAASDC